MATNNEDYDAAKIIKIEIEKIRQATVIPWAEDIVAEYLGTNQPKSQTPAAQQMRFTQNAFQQPPPQQQYQQPPPQQFNASSNNFNQGMPKRQTEEVDPTNGMMGRMNIGRGSQYEDDSQQQQQIAQLKAKFNATGSSLQESISPPSTQKPQIKGMIQQVPQMPPQPINVDDQVIPALNQKARGGPPQEYENDEDEDNKDDAEPITGEKRILAEPLIQMFGEMPVRKIFSRTWQLREEGLNEIENIIRDGLPDQNRAFVNGIGAVKFTIGDKMAQVSQKSMQFLIQLVRSVNVNVTQSSLKGELNSYRELIMSILSDKLGDNLQKVRNLAEDSFLALAEHQSFGVNHCIGAILRASQPQAPQDGAPSKKAMQSNKHIIGRYQLLQKLLQSFQLSDNGLIKECVKFGLTGIQNSVQEVRNMAYKCMSELYKLVGPSIRDQCSALRPAQMEQLEIAFAEVDGGPIQPRKQAAPKETIVTNIEPMGGGSKKTNAQKQPAKQAAGRMNSSIEQEEDEMDMNPHPGKKGVMNSPIPGQRGQYQQPAQTNHNHAGGNPPEQTCNFCGRYDPQFNDESLDIHYWKECPMLAQCWECGQVIEISHLDEHLLEECEQRRDYKLCSKCKGVYRIEDFSSHDCVKPRPPGAVKCQLCKESVNPNNEDGWKRHILDERCTANPRSV